MTLNEYQQKAGVTAIYPSKGENIIYPTLGLVGEAGEIANKVKKIIRDDNGILTEEKKEIIKDELGDVLWYLAALSLELGADLETIAKNNISKLYSRMKRGKIKGDGDNR